MAVASWQGVCPEKGIQPLLLWRGKSAVSMPPGDTKGDFCKTTLHLNHFRYVLVDGLSCLIFQILIQVALPRVATTHADYYTAEKTGRGTKNQEKQAMQMQTIAHHQLTNAQPVPEQWPLASLPPSFIAKHDIIWSGISLWSVGVSCPSCVPSQLFLHIQPTH